MRRRHQDGPGGLGSGDRWRDEQNDGGQRRRIRDRVHVRPGRRDPRARPRRQVRQGLRGGRRDHRPAAGHRLRGTTERGVHRDFRGRGAGWVQRRRGERQGRGRAADHHRRVQRPGCHRRHRVAQPAQEQQLQGLLRRGPEAVR